MVHIETNIDVQRSMRTKTLRDTYHLIVNAIFRNHLNLWYFVNKVKYLLAFLITFLYLSYLYGKEVNFRTIYNTSLVI